MTSTKPKALRMNEGKPMFSFILDFPKALLGFCRVKEIGALKYDFDNWTKGGKPDREYLDAALRHMIAFKSGKQIDDETGCHHLAHAAWNLFVLLELNVDEVYDVEKFKGACEYWKARKESPVAMSNIDRVILGKVHAFLVDKKQTEAEAEDERAAIAKSNADEADAQLRDLEKMGFGNHD